MHPDVVAPRRIIENQPKVPGGVAQPGSAPRSQTQKERRADVAAASPTLQDTP